MERLQLKSEILSVSHLVSDHLNVELVCNDKTFTLPQGLVLLVSPLVRSVLRTLPPGLTCMTPQIMIPDVTSGAVSRLAEIIQHCHQPEYQHSLTLQQLRQLDDLFDVLKVDTNFFKINIKDNEFLNDTCNEDIKTNIDNSYGFETKETELNDSNTKAKAQLKREKCETAKEPDNLSSILNQLEEFLEDSDTEEKEEDTLSKLMLCQFCPVKFPKPELITHLKIHHKITSSNYIIRSGSKEHKMDEKNLSEMEVKDSEFFFLSVLSQRV